MSGPAVIIAGTRAPDQFERNGAFELYVTDILPNENNQRATTILDASPRATFGGVLPAPT